MGAQADQECLKGIVKQKLPDLHKHLENLDIDMSSITLNWFLSIFIDSVPFEVFLPFLYRFAYSKLIQRISVFVKENHYFITSN